VVPAFPAGSEPAFRDKPDIRDQVCHRLHAPHAFRDKPVGQIPVCHVLQGTARSQPALPKSVVVDVR